MGFESELAYVHVRMHGEYSNIVKQRATIRGIKLSLTSREALPACHIRTKCLLLRHVTLSQINPNLAVKVRVRVGLT